MTKNQGVSNYQSMHVLSAKPEKLILMLYDGALRFLQLSIKGMEEKNIELGHNNLIKTQNILVELMASLNFDRGGEIARNLFRIYEFMHHTLVQANLQKEVEPVRRVQSQLRKIRDSWAQAMKEMAIQPEAEATEVRGKKIELTG